MSMDGKGRYLDNIFVERLWRSVKYEYAYPCRPESVRELERGLGEYFAFYNGGGFTSRWITGRLPRCIAGEPKTLEK